MKPLLVLLVVLQAATLAVVAGVLLRPDSSASLVQEFGELRSSIQGALYQQRQLTLELERMRVAAAAQVGSEPAPPPAASATGQAPANPDPPVKNLYREAEVVVAELRLVFEQIAAERERDNNFVEPLLTRQTELTEDLIDRGAEALMSVNAEVGREPFEDPNPKYAEYLLRNVVPHLAAYNEEAAFKLARSALVNAAGETYVRFAGAVAMREIDSTQWVDEVLPVIAVSGDKALNLRVKLLEIFRDDPRPGVFEVCERFLGSKQYHSALRSKAVEVLPNQTSGAVDALLRQVLFEDPDPLLKVLALEGFHDRLGDKPEMQALLKEVLEVDPAQMPPRVQEKARLLLEGMAEAR